MVASHLFRFITKKRSMMAVSLVCGGLVMIRFKL